MTDYAFTITNTKDGVAIFVDDQEQPILVTAGSINFSKSGFALSLGRTDEVVPVLVEENQTARGYV